MTADDKKVAVRLGRQAEWLCRLALQVKGWRILAHGHRARRGTGAGEIDLIAKRGQVVAFVEVKARANYEQGVLAVSHVQRDRIVQGAMAFLARTPGLSSCDVRFDVMVVRPWRWPIHLADAWRPDA